MPYNSIDTKKSYIRNWDWEFWQNFLVADTGEGIQGLWWLGPTSLSEHGSVTQLESLPCHRVLMHIHYSSLATSQRAFSFFFLET
jgi:hypothetical protein